jgi:hypothetical protein
VTPCWSGVRQARSLPFDLNEELGLLGIVQDYSDGCMVLGLLVLGWLLLLLQVLLIQWFLLGSGLRIHRPPGRCS